MNAVKTFQVAVCNGMGLYFVSLLLYYK